MVTISNQIDVDIERVFRNIGYCTDYKPSARIASLTNEYVDNVCHLIEPSYSYVIKDINLVHGPLVVIEDAVIFQSKIIARLLEQCDKVAVFLATIGNHLEEMVSRLAEDGLIVQATVLDAIGSGVAETVASFVQDRISETARARGLAISQRFSPGYCDWDVSQQKEIFRAMGDDSAAIHLTEGCLMLPRKSISGIIGIGHDDIENYNPCKTCDKHDCQARR